MKQPTGSARFRKLEPYIAQACNDAIQIEPASLGFSPASLVTALNHVRRLLKSGEQQSRLIPRGYDVSTLKIRILTDGKVELAPLPQYKPEPQVQQQSRVERINYPSPEADEALLRATQDKDWLTQNTILLICSEHLLKEAFDKAALACDAVMDKARMQVMLT